MSTFTVTNELLIDADVEKVWDLTIDVERWPDTTPTITEVTLLDPGPVAVGTRARIVQPRQRPRVWTVGRLEPNAAFEWSTEVGPLTMTGGHRLTPTEHGTVNLLTVELTGRGATLAGRLLGRQLAKAIATENQGFKTAAESTLTP